MPISADNFIVHVPMVISALDNIIHAQIKVPLCTQTQPRKYCKSNNAQNESISKLLKLKVAPIGKT